MDGSAERRLMLQALALAERGWGRVQPNPLVGAIVERNGVIVGEGWHAEYGGPHAERNALAAAGEAARGATLYVTLEPCVHHGKTPPCTDAIVEAGIRRVVFAAADPNPDAMGGAETLRAAGLDVVGGVEADAARALNADFFHVHERATPFVALKLALSLDGRIGRTPGARTRITGEAAAAEVQHLRAGFDAIFIGIGTALADDPLLTARGSVTPRVPPVRVIADSRLRLPADGRLARGTANAPVWVLAVADAPAARAQALERAGVRILHVPAAADGIDVGLALDRLRGEGIRTVLCEGGGRLAASLLSADRVARLILFIAPVFLGEEAVPGFPLGAGIGGWRDRGGWRLVGTEAVGSDALAVWDRDFSGS